jgi:hypothetical protein
MELTPELYRVAWRNRVGNRQVNLGYPVTLGGALKVVELNSKSMPSCEYWVVGLDGKRYLAKRVGGKKSIQERFEEYDAANPDVYELLTRFVGELHNFGVTRYGIAAFIERIRYDYAISNRLDEFKINNNLRSRYVRKLVADFPEYEHMFECRELKAL